MDTDLSLRIMSDLFKFMSSDFEEPDYLDLNDVELVIINLNSVFSTTFYESMIDVFNEDEEKMNSYVESIGDLFKQVLTYLSSQRIIMLYTDQVVNFVELYPDWKKERFKNKKKNKFAQKIYQHFIEVFNEIKTVNPTVDIINTGEFAPCIFVHGFINIRGYDKPVFLISRDRLDFLLLENDNLIMFDGQEFYIGDKFEEHTVKKIPRINIHFLKYWYRIRGIKKYSYYGVRGKGPIRTKKYLEKNQDHIIDGKSKYDDEKEMCIFDFDKYVNVFLKDDRYDKLVELINNTKF